MDAFSQHSIYKCARMRRLALWVAPLLVIVGGATIAQAQDIGPSGCVAFCDGGSSGGGSTGGGYVGGSGYVPGSGYTGGGSGVGGIEGIFLGLMESIEQRRLDREPENLRRSYQLGQSARKLADRGGIKNLKEALLLFHDALAEDPTDHYAWLYMAITHVNYELARLYAEEGNWAAALPHLQAAADLNQQDSGELLEQYRSVADQAIRQQQGQQVVADALDQPIEIAAKPEELLEEQRERRKREYPASLRGARIGAAAAVQGEVSVRQPDGSWRTIQSGDVLRSHDIVRTGPGGKLLTLLLDETVFTIGPDTELVLDEFIYDPFTEEGTLAAILTKGVIRFVSGKVARRQPKENKIKVPVGALGIRGTDFVAEHDASTNSSTVHLNEGELEITPDATGQPVLVSAPTVTVIDESGIVSSSRLTRREWEKATASVPSAQAQVQ